MIYLFCGEMNVFGSEFLVKFDGLMREEDMLVDFHDGMWALERQ